MTDETIVSSLISSDSMRISREEFVLLKDLIKAKFGIHLEDTKVGLVESRLGRELKNRGFYKFIDYYHAVIKDGTGEELQNLANMISTNHTFFNREKTHFKFFQDTVLPELTKRANINKYKDLRIWCCASSSGEEPIMIMISMLEFFGSQYHLWKAGLLATDISMDVLTKAQRGEYEASNLANLPTALRDKYFQKINEKMYRVKDVILKEIKYARYNLITGAYRFSMPFHCIFCRNVMIYFDKETKNKLIHSLYNCLAPGGYLFIGHTESLNGLAHTFENIMPAVYKK